MERPHEKAIEIHSRVSETAQSLVFCKPEPSLNFETILHAKFSVANDLELS